MNRKVKISIILSLIIAVLAAIFVIFCDPIEKIKWSIEQSKIEDKVIYSRWNDKFGWSLCNTYNKSFTLEIFKAFNTVADTKAISDETNRHQSKVRVNLKKIVDDESELEKFEISPKELSEKYVIGIFGWFKTIDWTSDESMEAYLWQDKYLVYSGKNYHYGKECTSVQICNIYTGEQYVYEHSLEANRPEDVEEVPERLIEPRYYLIGEDLICIYKYYNKLYCAELA